MHPDIPDDAELDEETDEKVGEFSHSICRWIAEHFPEKGIELDDDDVAISEDRTLYTRQAFVSTDLGRVLVVPDFKNKSAAALVINMGAVSAMLKEGFTYHQIATEGRIYSDPVPYTPSSVEVLGYYLTHRLNIVP